MPQKILNKLLSFFIIIIVIMMCFLIFIFSKPLEKETINYIKKKPLEKEEIKSITGGSLYLSPTFSEISVPSMKDQLEIYYIECRFDSLVKKDKFDVKFKNSNKIKKVCEEDKLYLVAKQDSFEFSDEKTALLMQLKRLDLENVKVILEADLKGLNIDSDKGNIFESFILPMSDLSLTANLEDKFEFKTLMCSKWWGIDHFLNIRNKEAAQKQRLEIDGDILYIDEKDVLIFKDGKWTVAGSNDNTLDYSVAKIKSINFQAIEIEAWDVVGSSKYSFSISPNPKAPFLVKTDQLISSVKRRTNIHFSCIMDKQRLVLKEKDMLIKKDNRWKLLKKDVVLDDIKNEELFYFEKIEERNSKKFLIGYLFNPMRTNFQKIEVPIISFANQKRVKKR